MEDVVGAVIWSFCVGLCGMIFLGMGIFGGKSNRPMGFWSGKEVKPEEIRDVKAYNQGMKKLWCIYGTAFFVGIPVYLVNPFVAFLFITLVVTLGLFLLVRFYGMIYRKYRNPDYIPTGDDSLNKKLTYLCILVTGVVLAGCFLFVGTGEIQVDITEESVKITTTYDGNTRIRIADITELEYRENFDAGRKKSGFNGFRIEAGRFSNAEFERYHLYRYRKNPACILIRTEDGITAVNLETIEETEECYDRLKACISGR